MEISRARDSAELVTDNANTLRERLEVVTWERIAALEALAPEKAKTPEKEKARAPRGLEMGS